MLRDVIPGFHGVRTHQEHPERLLPEDFYICPFYRTGIPAVGQQPGVGLGGRDLPLLVNHHYVLAFLEDARIVGLIGRSGNFGHPDGQEIFAQYVQLHVVFLEGVGGTQGHLLGPAPSGDYPDAEFDQADIGLCRSDYLVRMEAEFAAPPEAHAVGCRDHRDGRIAHPHHGILEILHRQGQFVVLLFHGQHKDHADVGTHRKVGCLVPYHQAVKVLFGQVDGLV